MRDDHIVGATVTPGAGRRPSSLARGPRYKRTDEEREAAVELMKRRLAAGCNVWDGSPLLDEDVEDWLGLCDEWELERRARKAA